MNVLVLPGGTEIAQEVHRALRCCKDVSLFSGGIRGSSHGPYVYARYFEVPSVRSDGWIDALNALIRDCAVDYVYPALDDVMMALSTHRAQIACACVLSPHATCEITRSKAKTYRHLAGVVSVPRVYPDIEAVDLYPIVLKPDIGQGSQRVQLAHDASALRRALDADSERLICEHLPGLEYTVDCFSDREKGLLYCAGRERVRTRNGISMHTRLAHHPEFEVIARRICESLTFHGAWFFQVKARAGGELALLEVAPRIAGTSALARVQGVNLPLLSLYEQERKRVEILSLNLDTELDRALANRYRVTLQYRVAYIDLDDTLVVRGNVNTILIAFLYQCLNRGVKLVLLTRHAGNPQRIIAEKRLVSLFDEVKHLGRDEPKSSAIRDTDAIMIDDSFSERVEVHRKRGIPVFDCSMVEMLMDDRA